VEAADDRIEDSRFVMRRSDARRQAQQCGLPAGEVVYAGLSRRFGHLEVYLLSPSLR
jgi:hypothetical protein